MCRLNMCVTILFTTHIQSTQKNPTSSSTNAIDQNILILYVPCIIQKCVTVFLPIYYATSHFKGAVLATEQTH